LLQLSSQRLEEPGHSTVLWLPNHPVSGQCASTVASHNQEVVAWSGEHSSVAASAAAAIRIANDGNDIARRR